MFRSSYAYACVYVAVISSEDMLGITGTAQREGLIVKIVSS